MKLPVEECSTFKAFRITRTRLSKIDAKMLTKVLSLQALLDADLPAFTWWPKGQATFAMTMMLATNFGLKIR